MRPNLPSLAPAKGELLHLDLMRLIACIGIVLHHSNEFFFQNPVQRAFFHHQWRGVALFVDLFFVISGFVIAYRYDDRIDGLAGYGDFMRRRVARLIPLHWLTLAISFVMMGSMTLLQLPVNHSPSFKASCVADAAFLLHAFLPCGNGMSFNGQSWSISVEMGLYLLFPLIALVGRRSAGLLFLLCFFLLCGGFAYGYGHRLDWASIFTIIRGLPSFLFGIGLFYIRSGLARFALSGWGLAFFVVALCEAMLGGAPSWAILMLVYATAIAAVASDMRGKPCDLVRKIAPYGCLTYSIYMWHGIFILALMNGLADKFLHGNGYAIVACTAICWASIFVTSLLSYKYIETPARLWIDGLHFGGKSVHPDFNHHRRVV